MKLKMSITIDENKIKTIEEYIRNGVFRNKSHALEQALDLFLKDLGENKK